MLLTKHAERNWSTTPFEGIERNLLRNSEGGGRTSFVRMAQGAKFPRHRHQTDEDVVVMEGHILIGGEELTAGDYLHTCANEEHDIVALSDSVLFVSSERPTEFTEQ